MGLKLEDYLRKKGMIPNQNFGSMYFVYFNKDNNVIEKISVEIWDVKELSFSKKTYIFKESPYEIEFEDDKGESLGMASGFGDLLRWGYYGFLDDKKRDKKYKQLLKESKNWNKDQQIIMPVG